MGPGCGEVGALRSAGEVERRFTDGAPVCDHIAGITSLALGGTLELQLVGNAPVAGQSFDLWEAAGTTGAAPALSAGALPEGLFYHTWSLVEDGTLRVSFATETFGEWLSVHNAGTSGDINGDGVPNLLEHALAIDPDGGGNTLPAYGLEQGVSGKSLSLAFDLPVPCPPGLTYVVEVSEDCSAWQAIAERSGNGDWSGSAAVTTFPAADGMQHHEIVDAASAGSRRFIRLRVERPTDPSAGN